MERIDDFLDNREDSVLGASVPSAPDMARMVQERTWALTGHSSSGSTFPTDDVDEAANEQQRPIDSGSWSQPLGQRLVEVTSPICIEASQRWSFWEAASCAFHPGVLCQPPGPSSHVGSALQVVFGFLEPLLFHLRPADMARFARPPPELFVRPTFKNFKHQYYVLRQAVYLISSLRVRLQASA